MTLQCCSCGQQAPGKQWWNRDTGFGICPSCFEVWVQKMGREEAIRACGHPGIHHSLNVPIPTLSVPVTWRPASPPEFEVFPPGIRVTQWSGLTRGEYLLRWALERDLEVDYALCIYYSPQVRLVAFKKP